MKLAKALRKAFDDSEMTLSQFAEKVGVSVSTAHGWIHGTHGVRVDKLAAIAKALNTDVAELVA